MKQRFGSKYRYGISCTASKFDEQMQWVIDTVDGGEWEYMIATFWFVYEADAVLFQLRWS